MKSAHAYLLLVAAISVYAEPGFTTEIYIECSTATPQYKAAAGGQTTIYTTTLTTFCPTGLTAAPATITAVCPGSCADHPSGSGVLPPGLTTTVTACTKCGAEPLTATLTVPLPANTGAAGGPSGGTSPPGSLAELKQALGYPPAPAGGSPAPGGPVNPAVGTGGTSGSAPGSVGVVPPEAAGGPTPKLTEAQGGPKAIIPESAGGPTPPKPIGNSTSAAAPPSAAVGGSGTAQPSGAPAPAPAPATAPATAPGAGAGAGSAGTTGLPKPSSTGAPAGNNGTGSSDKEVEKYVGSGAWRVGIDVWKMVALGVMGGGVIELLL